MTPRGEMVAALGALALGSLVVLVVAGQPSDDLGVVAGQSPDGDTSAATALSLVVLAGGGALLLVRGRARPLIGVLLVAVAIGIVAVNLGVPRSLWAWLGASGGTLAGLGALAVVLRSSAWPEPRRRYEASAPNRGRADDPWDALDRGEDPTA